MTMLMKDRDTEYSLGDLLAIPLAAGERVFAGSLVCSNEGGFAVPADDAADLMFEGVACEECDNRDGGDGDDSVIVRRRGRYRFDCETPLNQGAMSAGVYALDDQTVYAAMVDGRYFIACGVIDKIAGEHDVWVSIDATVLNQKIYRMVDNDPRGHFV